MGVLIISYLIPSSDSTFLDPAPIPSSDSTFLDPAPIPSLTRPSSTLPPIPSLTRPFSTLPPIPSLTRPFSTLPPIPSLTRPSCRGSRAPRPLSSACPPTPRPPPPSRKLHSPRPVGYQRLELRSQCVRAARRQRHRQVASADRTRHGRLPTRAAGERSGRARASRYLAERLPEPPERPQSRLERLQWLRPGLLGRSRPCSASRARLRSRSEAFLPDLRSPPPEALPRRYAASRAAAWRSGS